MACAILAKRTPPLLSSFYGLGANHWYKWKIPFKRNLAKQNPCPCRKIQRQGLQIRSRMRTACVCGDFLCRQGSILYRKSQLQNAPLCLFPTLLYAYPIASIRLQCLPIVKMLCLWSSPLLILSSSPNLMTLAGAARFYLQFRNAVGNQLLRGRN